MKIQCKVCETSEANVFCCADEATLCWSCDEEVHTANKLASKHQRVPLSSSGMPKCDICEEAVGFIVCIEDRALLCHNCDVAIHTANDYVSTHQRFLFTGVKVGLDKVINAPSPFGAQVSLPAKSDKVSMVQVDDLHGAGGLDDTTTIQHSPIDEYLIGSHEFNLQNHCIMEHSVKADNGKFKDSESGCLSIICPVQDGSLMVPRIPHLPAGKEEGSCCPKDHKNLSNAAGFVPQVVLSSSLPLHKPNSHQRNDNPSKRLRKS